MYHYGHRCRNDRNGCLGGAVGILFATIFSLYAVVFGFCVWLVYKIYSLFFIYTYKGLCFLYKYFKNKYIMNKRHKKSED